MPPKIALILCILFILGLFIIDSRMKSRQQKDVSNALWIPLIWLLISGSRSISDWFHMGPPMKSPDGYLEGNPVDRVILSILIFLGLYILLKRKIIWQVFQNNKIIALFFIYCGYSVLWSEYSFVSFKRWIKVVGHLIMIMVILSEQDPFEAVKKVLKRSAYVLMPLSVITIKYFPDLGRDYSRATGDPMYIGVTSHKNSLGMLCLIFGIFFFWNLLNIMRKDKESVDPKEKFANIVLFLIVLWLLNISQSATSTACLIVGILFLTGVYLPFIRRNIKYFEIYFIFMILLYVSFQILFDINRVLITSLGRDMTFTGRTEIWKSLLGMVQNPFIGTGFESFWLGDRAARIWAAYGRVNQAHNGYLEIYLNLGLIGLSLLIGIIVSSYKKTKKVLITNFEYGSIFMTYLVVFVLYNFTEGVFKGVNIVWFVFILIPFICSAPASLYAIHEEPELLRRYPGTIHGNLRNK
jgi:exopolysaccharide production protein ExoQ